MSASLLISAFVGIGIVCARLAHAAVLLAVSYLALRRSAPSDRTVILRALGPVLGALRGAESQDNERSPNVRNPPRR